MSENAKRDSNRVPVQLGWTGTEVVMLRCDADGKLSTTFSAAAATPEHHNGTATVTPAQVTFSGTSKSLAIHVVSLTNDLLISFDGGTNWYTLEAGSYWNKDLCVTSVYLKSSASTAAYEIVAAV